IAEIGDIAARVIPEIPEGAQEPVGIEWNFGRWPQVHIPIEPLRRRLQGLAADPIRRLVGVVPDPNELDLPDIAPLDHLGDFLEVRGGAVLRPDLYDALVLAR